MTLNSSFFNDLKEDRKRRTWTLVLYILACVFLTFLFELSLENTLGTNSAIRTNNNFEDIYALVKIFMMPVYLCFSGAAACLFGYQGFGWLMSRQKVDFYHSLPVTRAKRFFIIYINGILMFFLPFFVHTVIAGILAAARGGFSKMLAGALAANLGWYLLAFLLIYHIVIVAMMMTGHLLISFLATGTFLFYTDVLRLLLEWLCSTCFETYDVQSRAIFDRLSYLSPGHLLFSLFRLVSRWKWTKEPGIFLGVLIFTAMGGALALKLYFIRPSESAQKALAFPKCGAVIRFLIVIPMAILSGVLFYSLSDENVIAWLYLGCAAGAVFFHGFMEVVFRFDIRAAWGKKIQMAAGVLISLAVIAIFQGDLLGYDRYIPKESDLKKVSFSNSFGNKETVDIFSSNEVALDKNGDVTFLDTWDAESEKRYQISYEGQEQYQKVYDMLKKQIEGADDREENEECWNFRVCYELNSGKKVYRCYAIGKSFLEENFASIYEDEEFKKSYYQAMKLTSKHLEQMEVLTPFMSKTLEFGKEEVDKLLEVYRQDILDKTFVQYEKERQIGMLEMTYRKGDRSVVGYLPVSDTNSRTLSYLKEKGVDLSLGGRDYEVHSMSVSKVEWDADPSIAAVVEDFIGSAGQRQLNKDEQKKLLPYLIFDDYIGYQAFSGEGIGFNVSMEVKNKKTEIVTEVTGYVTGDDTSAFLESIKKK